MVGTLGILQVDGEWREFGWCVSGLRTRPPSSYFGELFMLGESATSLSDVEGIVKWFDQRKGFGFIIGPNDQDIFTHFSVIQGDGFRSLKDGTVVRYDAQRTDKGWKATRVVPLQPPPVTVTPRKGYARTPRR